MNCHQIFGILYSNRAVFYRHDFGFEKPIQPNYRWPDEISISRVGSSWFVIDSTSCMISILLLITWYWISRYSEKKVWNWCKNKAFSLNKYTNFGRSRLQSISLIIFLLSARKNVCNNFIIIKMHIICVVNYVVFALHLAKNEHVDVMRLE